MLAAIDDQTVEQHSPLTFTATATDADRPFEHIDVFIVGQRSQWRGDRSDVTAEFTWTPMMDSPAGVYTFNVVVEDGNGNQDSQSVNVEVTSG